MRTITLREVRNSLSEGQALCEAFGFVFEEDCIPSRSVQYVMDKVFSTTVDELDDLISRYQSLGIENKMQYPVLYNNLVEQVLILCLMEQWEI